MEQLAPIAYARTCYRHMAGWFGVAVTETMVARRILVADGTKSYIVTPAGIFWFKESLNIVVPSTGSSQNRRNTAVQCLDGTERRPHLAGWLGRALYQQFLERKWVLPITGTRALRITPAGKSELKKLLGMAT